jgi:hypothetical protein
MTAIAMLKELDAGTKGLATEGKVVYCKPRKHLQGTSQKTGKDYDFYSQFIIIEDVNEHSIVVDLSDSLEVQKGQSIKVYKGLLKPHVDNKGNNTVKLSAQLVQDGSQGSPQTPPEARQATNTPAGGINHALALCDQLRTAIAGLGGGPNPHYDEKPSQVPEGDDIPFDDAPRKDEDGQPY